jgi:hypothetical protein
MNRIIMCIGLFCITAFVTGNENVVSLPIISGIVMNDPYPLKMQSTPVSNARVELRTIYSTKEGNITHIVNVYGTVIDSTITDSNGKFNFQLNTSQYYYLVVITHSDHRTRQIALTATRDTTLNVLLIKNSAVSSVSGAVIATCINQPGLCNPKPVPGCSVSVCLNSYSLSINEPAKHVIYNTLTDTQGNYFIKDIPLSFNGEQVDVTATKSGVTKLVSTTVKNTETTIANFNGFPINLKTDTFQVYPSRPTSNDSVLFLFYNATDSCCSIYRDMTLSVVDSTIYIGYNQDNTQCADSKCTGNGKWATFKSKPLHPGNYNVYKLFSRDFCSPGVPCLPMPTLAPIARLIGTLTVTKPVDVITTYNKLKSPETFTLTIAGSSVTVNLDKTSRVILKAYSINGALLGEIFNGSLSSGSHNISINNLGRIKPASGMILLNMTVNGISKTLKRINAERNVNYN